jgi:transposase
MKERETRLMISDGVWKQMEEALLQSKHSHAGAPASMSDRDFLEAMIYLARTGCPWRDLPEAMGYWHAVYMRFRRWQKRGVWQRLWQTLQKEQFACARRVFIDSTTIRAHPHAAGAPKKTARISVLAALGVDSQQRYTPPA